MYGVPPWLAAQIAHACSFVPAALEMVVNSAWSPPVDSLGQTLDFRTHLTIWPQNGPGFVPTGLLHDALWAAYNAGVRFEVEDRRVRPDPGMPDTGPIALRDYQRVGVDTAELAGRGVIVMPPRGGKTRCGVEYVRRLWLPTVWIAPTTNLVQQTVRVFDDLLGKNFAAPSEGSSSWRSLTGKMVAVCTYASARDMPPEFYATRQVLVVDEVHHGAAPTLHAVGEKCEHVFHRLGLTGTYRRSSGDEVALRALASDVVSRTTTSDLVRLGFLCPLSVAEVPVLGKPAKTGNIVSKMKTGVFEHPYRNQMAAWVAASARTLGFRVLILVGAKEQGHRIVDMLEGFSGLGFRKSSTAPLKPVEFVSTDRPASQNQAAIESFAAGGTVGLLVGTSMVGEGTDMPAADMLVYAPGQGGTVSHEQAYFRVATKTPTKRAGLVVDFRDGHDRTLRAHALERARNYREEPIATFREVGSPEELWGWLHSHARSIV